MDAFLIRAAFLYLPLTTVAILWIVRQPTGRQRAGMLIASLWLTPSLLAVHLVAQRLGWWSFNAEGGVFLGLPVDLYLGWILLWGLLPGLLGSEWPLAVRLLAFGILDLAAMPLGNPVLVLGSDWLIGEGLALLAAFLPAQLLYNWGARDEQLYARVSLIGAAYAAAVFWWLPSIILELTGGSWSRLAAFSTTAMGLILQLMLVPGVLGLSAVQEFAQRGGGTPIPLDPPKRMVTSGSYAYIANPMQFTTALMLVGWGWVLGSWWVSLAGLMAVVYGVGFAAWSEGEDLSERFGEAWAEYRQHVRPWRLRWRPWMQRPYAEQPILYLAEDCAPCSATAQWIAERQPRGLRIAAAEEHPSRELYRVTYEPGEGLPADEGVAALGRALEHMHLGWALLGMFVRLPVVRPLIQLLVDCVGGEPKRVERRIPVS